MKSIYEKLDKISEFVINLGNVEKLKIDLRSRVMSSAEELIREINNIKQLAVGTLETIKCMPDYDEAIEKLKSKAKDEEMQQVPEKKAKLEVPNAEEKNL